MRIFARQLPQRRLLALTLLRSSRGLSSVEDVIRSGPIYKAANLELTNRWRELGAGIARDLKLDPAAVTTQRRIYQLYLPLYFWLRSQQKNETTVVWISAEIKFRSFVGLENLFFNFLFRFSSFIEFPFN